MRPSASCAAWAWTSSRVIRRPGRMGIYFLEAGAAQRASRVVYDRDGSAIALAGPAEFDWPPILDGASWFHVSGITPALSASAAEVALAGIAAARAAGLGTSLDLNYRAKLWRYGKTAPEVMRALMEHVDVAIGNEEDVPEVPGPGGRGRCHRRPSSTTPPTSASPAA